MQKYNLYIIILLIITGGTLSLGFAWYWIAIPTPGFKITESLGLILYLLFYSIVIVKKPVPVSDSIVKPFFWFLFLLGFIAFKNVLFDGLGIKELFRKITFIYIIMIIIPLIQLIRNPIEIRKFINSIYIIGFLSALVYLFQAFTGILLPASRGSEYGNFYRINHPGFLLVAFTVIFVMAELIIYGYRRKDIWKYIFAAICFMISILSLARGFIAGIIISVFMVLFINNFLKGRWMSIFGSAFLLIVIMFVGGLFFEKAGVDTDVIIERFDETFEEIQEDRSSLDRRLDMISKKTANIMESYPIFGVGFKYYVLEDPEDAQAKFEYYNHPYALNADSTLNNIIIIGGLAGLLFWILLFISIFRNSLRLYRNARDDFSRFVSISCFAMFFFMTIHSFSSNYFSTQGFLLITITFAFLYHIKVYIFRFHSNIKSIDGM